ncbi:hypothetical protein G7067_07945 [Leucobacter insecticola]|uniref:HTH luxR-type domain-containing protein n=1 Tax=Leucobacter insecticola TaxID=2714934 RepID=A0A6G8FJB0_9MICO|nr:LuxR C-terminal-related transcriptional regulator [Leucobacter insecticola]QIM16369.1 hypothetical protein G7067_07945 [Leucobacter insecticola]
MSYFARDAELQFTKEALLNGTSVELVGRPGSGRSYFLHAVTEELAQSGKRVVEIGGRITPSNQHHNALANARITDFEMKGRTVPSRRRDDLLDTVRERPSILVIDDARLLDEGSWEAVLAAHSEFATPILASYPLSPAHRTPGVISGTIATSSVRMHLRPLNYSQTSQIILERLDTNAELTVLSEIFAKSGGLPGVTLAILDAARASGALLLESDQWRLVRPLWSDALSGVVERLISGISRGQQNLVEAIGLFGALPLESALEIVDEEELENLELSAIVSIAEAPNSIEVLLDPPIIGDWATNTLSPLRRRTIQALVATASDDTQNLPPRPDAKRSGISGAIAEHGSSVANTFERNIAQTISQARDDYATQGTFASGVRLARLLQETPANATELKALHAKLSSEEPGQPESPIRTQYLISKLTWIAYQPTGMSDAAAFIDKLKSEEGQLSAQLLSAWIKIQICISGVPEDIREQLTQFDRLKGTDGAGAGWAVATTAFVELVLGRPVTALKLLEAGAPAPGDPHPKDLDDFRKVLSLWSTMANGGLTKGLEDAVRLLNDALRSGEPSLVRAFALPAAVCLHACGHYEAGSSFLGTVLSLGAPTVDEDGVYRALINYMAVFCCMSNNFSLAEAMTREAETLRSPITPYPAATSAHARASLEYFTGDQSASIKAAIDSFEDLKSRGLLLSAVDGALVGGVLYGAVQLVQAIIPLLPDMEGDWRLHYIGYLKALHSGNVLDLEASTEHLINVGRLAAAQFAATEIHRIHLANNDPAGTQRAAELQQRIRLLRDETDVASAPLVHGRHYRFKAKLTPRENDILQLARQGLSNQAIADALTVSLRTTETHMTSIFKKLGVKNRIGLLGFDWE